MVLGPRPAEPADDDGVRAALAGRLAMMSVRDAAAGAEVPALLKMLPRDVTLPAGVVEDAFIQANPDMTRNGITVTCNGKRLDEVRICLTRDLQPRDCAPDSRRDCAGALLMEAPG